eukprot:c17050_g1_i1.p1 GENE.c17050_g1_i1~~c17050_g1_i1.p1  ORF type:complete len:1669 (+),score=419.27 c17050_g1_i1:211-5007(+)
MDGTTALMFACKAGAESVVEFLLTLKKVDVNIKNELGNTALMVAAETEYVKIVDMLCSHPDVQVNLRNENEFTALIIAASKGKAEIFQRILRHPLVEINSYNKNRDSALIVASLGGHLEIVEALCEHSTLDVNHSNKHDNSSLMLAARQGHLTIVSCLAAKGADWNSTNEMGNTAVMLAADRGHSEIVEFACSITTVQLQVTNEDGNSALLLASEKGHIDTVKILAAQKGRVDTNATNTKRNTALMLAAGQGHTEIVEFLCGLPETLVNQKNTHQNTALLLGVDHLHEKIAEILCSHPSTLVNERNLAGNTALTLAAWHGNLNLVQLLCEHNADLNVQNQDGISPLMFASWYDRKEVVKHLCDLGANLDLCDKHGNSAVMLASWYGHLTIIQHLCGAGAATNLRNAKGHSALLIAAEKGQLQLVQYLCANGAVITSEDMADRMVQLITPQGFVHYVLTPHLMHWTPNTPTPFSWLYATTKPWLTDQHLSAILQNVTDQPTFNLGTFTRLLSSVDPLRQTTLLDSSPPALQTWYQANLFFCKRYHIDSGPAIHRSDEGGVIVVVSALDYSAVEDYGKTYRATCSKPKSGMTKDEFEKAVRALGAGGREEVDGLYRSTLKEGEGTGGIKKGLIQEGLFVEACKKQFGAGPRKVVLKLMESDDGFENECQVRQSGVSNEYIMPLIKRFSTVARHALEDDEDENEESERGKGKDGKSKEPEKKLTAEEKERLQQEKERLLQLKLAEKRKAELERQRRDEYNKRMQQANFDAQLFQLSTARPDLGVGSCKHCIVMPAGDRDAWAVCRVEGPSLEERLRIAQQIGTALYHLHMHKIVHCDVSLVNVVRHTGRFCIVDFDAAVIGDGNRYAGAKFSSGLLRPEMFVLMGREQADQYSSYFTDRGASQQSLARHFRKLPDWRLAELRASGGESAIDIDCLADNILQEPEAFVGVKTFRLNAQGLPDSLDDLPYEAMNVSAAADVWAFGLLLFEVMTGRNLLSTNRRYDLNRLDEVVDSRTSIIAGELAALGPEYGELRDILQRILVETGPKRIQTMDRVLEHPYFQEPGAIPTGQMGYESEVSDKQSRKQAGAREKGPATFESQIVRLTKEIQLVSQTFLLEMAQLSQVLLRGVISESSGPLFFALLPAKLPLEKANGSAEAVVAWLTALIDLVGSINTALQSANPKASIMQDVHNFCQNSPPKLMHLYLVDEYSGRPVEDGSGVYPLQVTNVKEFIRKHIAMLRAVLVAAYVRDPALGILRAHGLALEQVPRPVLLKWLEILKAAAATSQPKDFAVVQAAAHGIAVEDSAAMHQQHCVSAVRNLTDFITDRDQQYHLSSLRRLTLGRTALAAWTEKSNIHKIESSGAIEKRRTPNGPFQPIHDFLCKTPEATHEFEHFLNVLGSFAGGPMNEEQIKRHMRVVNWSKLLATYRKLFAQFLEFDEEELQWSFAAYADSLSNRLEKEHWKELQKAFRGEHKPKPVDMDDFPPEVTSTPFANIHRFFAATTDKDVAAVQEAKFQHYVRFLTSLTRTPLPATVETAIQEASTVFSDSEYLKLCQTIPDMTDLRSGFEAYQIYLLADDNLGAGMRSVWRDQLKEAVKAPQD